MKLTKCLLIVLFLISTQSLHAQGFDYNKHYEPLLKVSKDSTSQYHLPNLLKRLNEADTSLTDLDVLIMMIGFTDHPNYNPYSVLTTEENIQKMVSNGQFEAALDSCNHLLQTQPLNFVARVEKAYCAGKLNLETEQEDKYRVFRIVDGINYSGSGTKDDPYFVLGPRDGQILIRYFWGGDIGTMGSGDCEGSNFCDMLERIDADGNSNTIFFNIEHATKRMFNK